jgi:hypothetical protein
MPGCTVLSHHHRCRIRLGSGWAVLRPRDRTPSGQYDGDGRAASLAGIAVQLRGCMADPANRFQLRALLRQADVGVQRWNDAEVTAEVLRLLASGQLEAVFEEVVHRGFADFAKKAPESLPALGPLPEDPRRLRGRARGSSEPLRITGAPRAAQTSATVSGATRSTVTAATLRGGVRAAGGAARIGGAARGPSVPVLLEEGEQ